jgi:hypothetical protein
MVKEMPSVTKKKTRWTPRLIKQLRGRRSLADFAVLIDAPKNRVRSWEVGQAQPDATYAERLSELAVREHFLKDWRLDGSMTLVADLESAKAEISELYSESPSNEASREQSSDRGST